MPYAQFCALARAAEVLGERWSLLIVRELLLGAARFLDLQRNLDGVSTSVLAQRLAHLEAMRLIRRTSLDPPAAATVYELTPDGLALRPAVLELIRWGARRLFPPRSGERLDARWIRLALEACARRGPSPDISVVISVLGEDHTQKPVSLRVDGGPAGSRVTTPGTDDPPPRATLAAEPRTVLGLAAGLLDPAQAVASGAVRLYGDAAALEDVPRLFDITLEGAESVGIDRDN